MSAPLPVAEAQFRILAGASPMPAETVALHAAIGRVLAADVAARRRQPPGDVSAMDGYAVRADDLAVLPVTLRVTQTIPAGAAPSMPISNGEAARIFTGALLPAGADMVALQENAGALDHTVTIRDGDVLPGKHVRPGGSDFESGEVLLAAGWRLTPRDIALLAAMDVKSVEASRKPKVAVLATGDELVRPGAARDPAQIVAASLDGLLAQIEVWGGAPADLGIAPDNASAIATAIAAAGDADILITLGGASVGDHDLVKTALGADGLTLDFWRIAMRPGKPLMSGIYRGRPFLGLPGNPVSAMVCSLLFLKPMLWRMLGDRSQALRFGEARLAAALRPNDGREDYVRATFNGETVTPFPVQDSGQLRPLSAANVLLVRPANDPAQAAGARVRVLYLDQD
jgi:molybdopterin molybdotransferase